MGKEWVSKKDPREICQRTISNGTGNYATLKRPNPEYRGLTLEQAKAREKLKEMNNKTYKTKAAQTRAKNRKKELEIIAGLDKKESYHSNSNSEADEAVTVFIVIVLIGGLLLALLAFKGISNWWNSTEPWGSSTNHSSIYEAEIACTNKGMYSYRIGCENGIDTNGCHVVCTPYKQK